MGIMDTFPELAGQDLTPEIIYNSPGMDLSVHGITLGKGAALRKAKHYQGWKKILKETEKMERSMELEMEML